MLSGKITFHHATKDSESLILSWFKEEHVKAWFHGDGLKSSIKGLKEFINGDRAGYICWIACYDDVPFAYLITSRVTEEETKEPDNVLAKWILPNKKMLTIDILIGEKDYLGKGMAAAMLKVFIKDVFPDVDRFFIDPESTNTKAIHVYKKVGFEQIDSFIASWHPVPHTLMKLDAACLKN